MKVDGAVKETERQQTNKEDNYRIGLKKVNCA